MMYQLLYKLIKLVYPNTARVQFKHYKHPKHMEDMGNKAGNSLLPDVFSYSCGIDNLELHSGCAIKIDYSFQPPSILVISANNFNAISLDINNSIALILLYFGPTALIDGPRMHPVAMEDILNLALLGSEVPDAILKWKFPRSFQVNRRNNANRSIRCDDLNCAYDIHSIKALPSSLTETYF